MKAPAAGVFSSPGFRQYFIGQSLSMLGDGLRTLAIPLLAFKLTHSALSTGGAFVCEIAPFSVFALVGGSLADRMDRKRTMIAADAIRCAVMVAFALAWAAHALTLTEIYAGLCVISVCAALFLGGQAPSIPFLLGKDKGVEAIAALTGAENVANLVTPVIGGALFAYFGPEPALAINALTYLGSQISLSRIATLGPTTPAGWPTMRDIVADVKLGFNTLFGDRGMRAQAIAALMMNVFGFGGYSILIPFLKTDFGVDDRQVGLFLGVTAVGALIGSAVAARTALRWPFGRAITIAYALDALAFVPVVLTHDFWVAATAWGVSNALVMFEFAQIVGFRLRVTHEANVGRLMGAVRIFVLSALTPGILAFGWIADHRSPHEAMSIAVAGYLLLAIGVALTPAIRNETR